VKLLRSDWFAAVPEGEVFDLIVSNPPYLTEEEWETAQPEVRNFEPSGALVAAEEGRADLEKILRDAFARLAPGGLLALETGIAQHEALAARARERGYEEIESLPDMSGRDRFFLARKPGLSNR
jgi:release factor glutamine methyltransferase